MRDANNNNNTTTGLQTAIALLKGNIGPGCLALPWAFSLLGIPLGCIITVIMTSMVTWNAWTLVALKRQIWDINKRGVTYSDVGEQIYGPQFRFIIDMSVITVQLAVCTVFLSNMSENISSVLRQTLHLDTSGGNGGTMTTYVDYLSDKRLIMFLLLPPVLLLSSIPNLKRLAPSITLATFLMVASFLLIGVIIWNNWNYGLMIWLSNHQSLSDYMNDVQWNMVPLATCAIMYSLEGDQLILPIESSMANQNGFGIVLVVSMTIVGVLFCTFASSCVIAFGSVDGGSVTAFLMDHRNDLAGQADDIFSFTSPWGSVILPSLSTNQILLLTNVIVSLSLVFTYPLQLYPAIGLVGQIVAARRSRVAGHNNESKPLLVDSSVQDSTTGVVEIVNCYEATENQSSLWYQKSRRDDTVEECDEDKEYGDAIEDAMVMEGDSISLRVGLVLTTFMVAMIIPHLKALISLAGAVTGSATSLILPPLLASKFLEVEDEVDALNKYNGTTRRRCQMKLFYGSLIVVGWTYAIIGTVSSVEDIVSIYSNQTKYEN